MPPLEYLWCLLGVPVWALIFYHGYRTGRKRTIALFHELQDGGDLIVLTRQQHDNEQMVGLIRSEKDYTPDELVDPEEPKHKRASNRTVDWAGTIKQSGEHGGTEDES